MRYDAIALDSNIFIENRLNLEGGMHQQFLQFEHGSVQLFYPELSSESSSSI